MQQFQVQFFHLPYKQNLSKFLNFLSKETTFNTYTNTNILFNKDEILNFETPEDYHIFNVNVIQKGKKLAYKFENLDSSKIEIKKICEEF